MLNALTPEGRKALRLMTIETSKLVDKLDLPPRSERRFYSHAELCHMATRKGLTARDFLFK